MGGRHQTEQAGEQHRDAADPTEVDDVDRCAGSVHLHGVPDSPERSTARSCRRAASEENRTSTALGGGPPGTAWSRAQVGHDRPLAEDAVVAHRRQHHLADDPERGRTEPVHVDEDGVADVLVQGSEGLAAQGDLVGSVRLASVDRWRQDRAAHDVHGDGIGGDAVDVRRR